METESDRDHMKKALEAHDAISHGDMIHLLDTGNYETVFFDPELGAALRHPVGTVYAAPFTDNFMPLCDAIGTDVPLLNIENEAMSTWYRKEKNFDFDEPSIFYLYDRRKGRKDPGPYSYRMLGDKDYPEVRMHYAMGTDEQIARDIERGDMYGIFGDDGAMMGFCGFHAEGSMGLLEIFASFRGRGLGTAMESFVMNEAMSRGWSPFCNVYLSNLISRKLQTDLGLERGGILSYWVWPR